MRSIFIFAMIAGGLMLASYTSGFGGVQATLESGQSYRVDLMALSSLTDLGLLTQRAQSENWWVRVQQDTEVTYFQGQERCEACDVNMEDQFLTSPLLVLDSGLFLIELDTDTYGLTIRPLVDDSSMYEAIVFMKETLTSDIVSAQINAELSALGLNLGNTLSFEVAASPDRKVTVPEDVNLEETLYRLTQAPDWESEAMLRNFSLSGLRVRVVVELAEGQAAPNQFNLVVEQTGTNVLRAQVLIPDLIALAQDPAVVEVRPPLQAQPQV